MNNREERIEEDEQRWFEYLNIPYPYTRPPTNHCPSPDVRKILVLSDPHEPYGNGRVYTSVLNDQWDASVVVVPGDLGDFYSKSRFRKERHTSFRDELRAVFLRIEWLATLWPDVRIMLGNHDNRPEKTMADLLQNRTDMMILTEQGILRRLASYFDNVQIVGHRIEGIDMTHFYQHGDIIFCHGELSRKSREMVLWRISEYLQHWGSHLGLKPYRVIAQGHNHSSLKMVKGSECWFCLPTASDPYSLGMEYIYRAKLWGEPPAVGYSVFYQMDGVTDFNLSDNVVL